jgi:hypothetical protein
MSLCSVKEAVYLTYQRLQTICSMEQQCVTKNTFYQTKDDWKMSGGAAALFTGNISSTPTTHELLLSVSLTCEQAGQQR